MRRLQMKKLLLLPTLFTAFFLLGACSDKPTNMPVANLQLEANKQLVLNMWHEVIDGRNFDAARKYISASYKQNSPSATNGVEALITFLHTEFPDSQPLEAGSFPLTEFVFVLAEDDLVQLMFQLEVASSSKPAELVKVWWYDTYRIQDNMIVEHWDSIVE